MDNIYPKNYFWNQLDQALKRPAWVWLFSAMIWLNALLWLGIWFYLVYNFIYPFYSKLDAISNLENSYFEVIVNQVEKKAEYRMVAEKPKDWIDLKNISSYLRGAILTSEDGKFYIHPGYDIEEIQKAIYAGFVLKKKLRGASTITQQLVKNLFFQTDRSFWRKGQEMLLTLWMEQRVSKNKIFETYLNVIEFGEGLYGIKVASQYYFKKRPKDLKAREASFLAMLLPSPKRYSQSFRLKALTVFAQKRIQSILFKMVQRGNLKFEDYLYCLEDRFNWER